MSHGCPRATGLLVFGQARAEVAAAAL
jgi:hypothetical protein